MTKQIIKEGFKQCNTCKGIFPKDNEHFYNSKRNPDGFDYKCKECNREMQRKYQQKADKIRAGEMEVPELVHLLTDDVEKLSVAVGDAVRIDKRVNGVIVPDYFVGLVSDLNKEHFTVESTRGFKETFLKVDAFIGEMTINKF